MKILVLIGISTLAFMGCSKDKSKPNIEIIQNMMAQPNVKAQEYDDFFEDKAGGARVPPVNTAPVGFSHYKYKTDYEGAKRNPNPMAGDFSDETLMTGQKFYQTHCMVCHGISLKADTSVAKVMPLKPPALDTDKIKGWSDGELYHVITMGQGLMGGYASHIPQKYRWQVVNYIRYLQKNP